MSVAPFSDQQNTEGDTVSLQATATDLNNLPMTFSADGLPTGLSINARSGLITGTIAAGAANNGLYWSTITASDGTSSDTQWFNWNITSAVSVAPFSDQQNTEGDTVSLQATATDLNNLPLTFSANGLPTGLSINAQSGLITGTVAVGAADNGAYWTTITATDGTSTDSQGFLWNVYSTVSSPSPYPSTWSNGGGVPGIFTGFPRFNLYDHIGFALSPGNDVAFAGNAVASVGSPMEPAASDAGATLPSPEGLSGLIVTAPTVSSENALAVVDGIIFPPSFFGTDSHLTAASTNNDAVKNLPVGDNGDLVLSTSFPMKAPVGMAATDPGGSSATDQPRTTSLREGDCARFAQRRDRRL